ncbi:MAG: O-antigen ligase family protein, partial [Acidobacteriota bacterium]|nr:O-antigen ligase family protein [Acidobacteriota bacterium]
KGKNLRDFDDSKAEEEKPAALTEGDAIVEVEGKKIRTPDDLAAEIEKNETTYLECFRAPDYFTVKVRRTDLLDGASALEKLGISNWKHNRTWRFAGFYGQIITYAEVLQMIASLALGLFLALDKKRSPAGAILALCIVGMIFALLMTFTRATQIAFFASTVAMILLCGSRKLILALAIVVLPLALAGFFFVQQNRNVSGGKRDQSVEYRQTVYREGFDLWTSSTRNFLLGIGMDSTKRFAKDWHLFDDGRLPMGHFHSTPLQLLVERGLPALLLWLWILWLYARTLLRSLKLRIMNYELRNDEVQNQTTTNPKSKIQNPQLKDWHTRGIILGCFGGLVGFVGSSLVNYSLGDSEVAMVFYMLMGISVFLVMQNAKLKIQNTIEI